MPNRPGKRTGVKSDETMLAVLAALRGAGGKGVTELADELDVAKSTVHNHLSTMREHGFVVQRGDQYQLGLEFFSYGQEVRNDVEVYRAARPVVDDLVAETGEMVWLLTPEQGRMIYLYGRAGETAVDVNTILGSWEYMHCTSGGKAILAHYDDDQVDEVVQRHGLPARTANTISNREALAEELETVRERGYALNMGEDLEGIHAVAVPLLYEDDIRGSIAVAGPAHRVSRERCEGEILDALRASTNDVELNLAYA
jgi:IclR family acetate operon transcriptional repressor